MQMPIRTLSVFTLALFSVLTACKKNDDPSKKDTETQYTTHADDQHLISLELDAVVNDANIVFENNSSLNGRFLNPAYVICDASVAVDTTNNQRQITIIYNSSPCTNIYTRSGTVVISMPAGTRWRDAGATVTVNYQNLKITRISDNKHITINGTGTLTNVSGSRLIDLTSQSSIIHTYNSQITATFSDGSQRLWQAARKRVYTYNNGVVVTITGNHADGNNNGIAEWGTTRFGDSFTTSITQPLVFKQNCDFRLTSGQVHHVRSKGSATATFGLDVNGNAATCPDNGHFYLSLSWSANGNSNSLILPY